MAVQDALETATQDWGRRIFAEARRESRGLSAYNLWTQQVLSWCLKNNEVKSRMLRFVDVLPRLRTPTEIVRHIRDYFPSAEERLPASLRLGSLLATALPVTSRAVAGVVRTLTERMARQFIAGARLADIRRSLEELEARGMGFTLDLLGEATVSRREARLYFHQYLGLLRSLSEWAASHAAGLPLYRSNPRLDFSLKLTGLCAPFDPLHFDASVREASRAVRRLLRFSRKAGARVTLDMEQHRYRDLTLAVAKEAARDPEFGDSGTLGVVVQAYLRDSEETVRGLLRWLRENDRSLTVRLVKGAYWDSEIVTARQNGWAPPVFLDKAETDRAFERLTRLLLENHDRVRTALGSHNVRSLAHGLALAEHLRVPRDRYEIQLLYGMGDVLKHALVKLGQPVRVYAPFGELIPGMAYLVRRLLENTANTSFLRHDFLHDASPDELLRPPAPANRPKARPTARTGTDEGLRAFVNEPPADFFRPETRQRFQRALAACRQGFGATAAMLIDGQEITSTPTFAVHNPAHSQELVGFAHQGDVTQAGRAVHFMERARETWGRFPAAKRADILEAAAGRMRLQRWDLAALEVFETGKSWVEADADVCEAVDSLRYYAWQIRRLDAGDSLISPPGESNVERHVPRGPAVIISPWNFPLAILTGMSSAALAAGNAVLLKPSSRSPLVAYRLARIYLEAGVPSEAVHYLPGPGGALGDSLIGHASVAVIAFTGSKDVGRRILETASRPGEETRLIKKLVLELGGKNALIVDADADLDEAIPAIIASAFGYQGQKCSALSRLIVHQAVHDELSRRLFPALACLRIGPPEDPRNVLGPLIDGGAVERVKRYAEAGKREAVTLYETEPGRIPAGGHYAGPAVFETADPRSPLIQDEIFGPVLTWMRAGSFDEALRLARESAYALTGGLYSRRPAHIERAKREWDVGNLYINRKITGAVVGRQPFGGFRMSGTGTKAGGPEYLFHFMQPKTISENTLRHGFPLAAEDLE